MSLPTLIKLFDRDLLRLRNEIIAYKDESKIWIINAEIKNPGGNLCLHLVGNLKTYIGKELGGIPYERNRDLEFSAKNVPRQTLVTMIDETIAAVRQTLEKLTPAILDKDFPVIVFENKTSTDYMLIHLATHLGYHLGQVNYHRRLLDH